MFHSFFALRCKPLALLLFGWLLTLFLPAQIVSAQAPTPAWVARYTGPTSGYNAAGDLKLDAQGNVYVTGQSRGSSTASDYATVKYDAGGNQIWAARYHGPTSNFDTAYALAVDAQGCVYVTGSSPGSAGAYGAATIKYDTGGNQLWTTRYSAPNDTYDSAGRLAVDAQGSAYVTGQSRRSDNVNIAYLTIKYSGPSPANITPKVSITRSGFCYVRSTGHYTQTIIIRNTSASSISGPLFLVLDSLSANTTLFNRAGFTALAAPLNSPYRRTALTGIGNGDAVFDPGESVTFTVEFTNPANAAITYTPRVLAGLGTP